MQIDQKSYNRTLKESQYKSNRVSLHKYTTIKHIQKQTINIYNITITDTVTKTDKETKQFTIKTYYKLDIKVGGSDNTII